MASALSLPPIQTSLPYAGHSDDALRDATPRDGKPMAAHLEASSFTRDPEQQPQRGHEGASIKREEFHYADKQQTPDLLSPNTAFSQAAASLQQQQQQQQAQAMAAAAAAAAPYPMPSSYPPPPTTNNPQQLSYSYPGPSQQQPPQPYSATPPAAAAAAGGPPAPGSYYPNPYYAGPTAPWAYTLQPNQGQPAPQQPQQPPQPQQPTPPSSYVPPTAPQTQDCLAFSQAAAASLYNPALVCVLDFLFFFFFFLKQRLVLFYSFTTFGTCVLGLHSMACTLGPTPTSSHQASTIRLASCALTNLFQLI